mmetsp:Transcript_36528/g.60086  ORF Transcript_36528/g.60086 Transcript_36528/m.60086 type:complete len:82 (-) Transcript_36528:258-503(-)
MMTPTPMTAAPTRRGPGDDDEGEKKKIPLLHAVCRRESWHDDEQGDWRSGHQQTASSSLFRRAEKEEVLVVALLLLELHHK